MYLDKAGTLIEALPYIQHFQGATIVVKYGGSAMVDENLKRNVIQDVALLKLVGFRPIIVHGGGKDITKMLGKEPDQQEPGFSDGEGRGEGLRCLRKGRKPSSGVEENAGRGGHWLCRGY